MNETMTTLLNRRSIRTFKADQITDDELNAVLEAGKFAPSGANQQSALFVVVQDRKTRETLSAMNRAVNGGDADPYYGAPTVILVFADTAKVTPVEDAAWRWATCSTPLTLSAWAPAGSTGSARCSPVTRARHCSRSGAWRATTSAWEPASSVTPTANVRRRPRARTVSS